MPTAYTDPSGLFISTAGLGAATDAGAGLGAILTGIGIAVDAAEIGYDIYKFFDQHAKFTGTTGKRPQVLGSGDFGIPYPGLNSSIAGALGLPTGGGCEFGACGGSSTATPCGADNPSVCGSNNFVLDFFGYVAQEAMPWNHIPYHDMNDPNHRYFGSHHCGPGGGGDDNSKLDGFCHVHDDCYDRFNVDASVNFPWNHSIALQPYQIEGIKGCNQALANGARASKKDHGWGAILLWMTTSNPFLYPGTVAH